MRVVIIILAMFLLTSCQFGNSEKAVKVYECSQCGNVYYGYGDAAHCHNAAVITYKGYVDSNGNVEIAQ